MLNINIQEIIKFMFYLIIIILYIKIRTIKDHCIILLIYILSSYFKFLKYWTNNI